MLIVEYAPGAEDPVHRHNANAFVYVLEGSVVMQVKGGGAGHPSPWSDLLRRSQRHSPCRSQRQQDGAGEVSCRLR